MSFLDGEELRLREVQVSERGGESERASERASKGASEPAGGGGEGDLRLPCDRAEARPCFRGTHAGPDGRDGRCDGVSVGLSVCRSVDARVKISGLELLCCLLFVGWLVGHWSVRSFATARERERER